MATTGTTARRPFRRLIRTCIATVTCGAAVALSTPAVAVENPSDEAIEQAHAAVAESTQRLSDLAQLVTGNQARIAELDLTMGGLQEAMNKALVDLHEAQAGAEQARQGVVNARELLDGTQSDLSDAQDQLNELARTAYRRGASTVAQLAGAASAEDALDRQTYIRINAADRRALIAQLDKTRTENANQEASLREARTVAEERESEAEDSETAARQQLTEATQQLEALSSQREQLAAEQAAAESDLAAARGNAESLEQQRVQAEEEERQRQEAQEAAQREAAEKAAADAAAAAAAEKVAESQPDHGNLDSEVSVENAGDALVSAKDRTVKEETTTTVAASPETKTETATANATPTATATTTTTEPTTTVAQATTAAASSNGGSDSTSDSTSGTTSGSASERIEAVIARAKSQIGQPYVWGGGSASGPTRGIRDGGVADSYGDYNQVGFDCSGLVLYAFAGVGISLPHYTGYQYQRGTKVDPSQMKRGDLIFWGPNAENHVAIYLGDGQMIEAPHSGATVRVSPVRYSGMSPYVVRLIS